MGREEQLRKELNARTARQGQSQRAQAQQNVMARPAQVVDRFGRVLQEGDEVIFSPDMPLTYMVAGIQSMDHDPRVPPGTMLVRLEGAIEIPCTRGAQIPRAILVNRPLPATDAPPAGETTAPDAPEGEHDVVERAPGEPGTDAIQEGIAEPHGPEQGAEVGEAGPGPSGIHITDSDR